MTETGVGDDNRTAVSDEEVEAAELWISTQGVRDEFAQEMLRAGYLAGFRAARRDVPGPDYERALDEELANRDAAQEWADRLAYAIAPQSVIGEHSSLNNPWENALEIAATRDVPGGREATDVLRETAFLLAVAVFEAMSTGEYNAQLLLNLSIYTAAALEGSATTPSKYPLGRDRYPQQATIGQAREWARQVLASHPLERADSEAK